MGFGRVVCVALPFLLTLASLIALLVAGLAGVADKNLYIFQVNTTDLSISPASVQNLISTVTSRAADKVAFHDKSLLHKADTTDDIINALKTTNLTASDLNLQDLYDVSLWGYCYTPQNGSRTCTQPQFNWAESAMNQTVNNMTTIATTNGAQVNLPSEVTNAMKAFASLAKWTEVVFIIAYVSLGVELFFGLFANCSRALSCVTWLIAGVATVAVCGAAGLATTMAVVVVGSVEATAKWYGVTAEFNTRFLAAVWLAALFALAAGFFWLFTICCCAPNHSSRRSGGRKRHLDNEDGEKLMPVGAYQPLHEPQHNGVYGYNNNGNHNNHASYYGAPRYPNGAPRSDLAYEPYSHHNV